MFRYELKIALRKLLKSKLYTSLNIAGLAVGLAACLVVTTIVLDDLSYDKQWKHADQLYRIIGVTKVNYGIEQTPNTYSGLGPELKRNFPEVKSFCRMEVKQNTLLQFDRSKQAVHIQSLLAENTIWDMLDFTIIGGNPKAVVEGIDNIIITEQVKNQYYKDVDPIGKTIYDVSENSSNKYVITGVIKDIPNNTHLRAQVIILRSFLRGVESDHNKLTDGYSVAVMPQYLLLDPKTNPALFERKLNAWYKNQSNDLLAQNNFHLQPISDVYLRSNFNEPEVIHGSIRTVYAFAVIAVLILLIACINYVNLSTAKAIEKIRESGISKILGADRTHIMSRFLLESILFFLIAFLIAIISYALSLDAVEGYLGHALTLTLFSDLRLFGFGLCALLLVCVFTGLYPSYILTEVKPVNALRGTVNKKIGMGVLKKSLIITQFTIALIVLIGAITVNLQFRYLKNADPGYDKNNLLQIGFTNWGTTGESFKKELSKIPGVESASIVMWYPSYGPGFMSMETKDPRNENDQLHIWFIEGDVDFPKTLKLHLKSGRLFDPTRPTDAGRDSLNYTKVLVSDMYASIFKATQVDKPVEAFMHVPIGIIENFHNESLLEKEKPFIITASSNPTYGAMLIRITPDSEMRVTTALWQLWKQYYPAQHLSYNLVDDLLAAQYRKENRLSTLFNVFTSLTIFLACLGLFGLVTFMIETRMKEIGIRKVLGASVGSISGLISKAFLKLVIIAIFIASPIAWYFLNQWLQDYPYRIDIYWWVFVLAAATTLVIAAGTLSFQTIKAALANPVKSLRNE